MCSSAGIGMYKERYQARSQTIVQVNMVPEPATLGALGLGFAALLRRGKKRSNEAFTP